MLQASDDHFARLYPAESNHLDDVEVLCKPNVHFVGAFLSTALIGIGAVKVLCDDVTYGEIKRLFVLENQRGKGASKLIMEELENHLRSCGVAFSRLETGTEQPQVVRLYDRLGYRRRAPFGDYEQDPFSLFMEKALTA